MPEHVPGARTRCETVPGLSVSDGRNTTGPENWQLPVNVLAPQSGSGRRRPPSLLPRALTSGLSVVIETSSGAFATPFPAQLSARSGGVRCVRKLPLPCAVPVAFDEQSPLLVGSVAYFLK